MSAVEPRRATTATRTVATAQRRFLSAFAVTALAALALLPAAGARAQGTGEDPTRYIAFSEDFEAVCVEREGVMILIRNTHPTRPLRVWLERWHMNAFTGDRSKSDLAPGAEPEKLGCSRTLTGKQEWRVIRAQFLDPTPAAP